MGIKSLRRPLGVLIAGLIIFFIARSLTLSLRSLGHYSLEFAYLKLLVAFAIVGVLFVCYGLLWKSILASFGSVIGFRDSMRIWFLSQAAKYIPGKVWFAFGRVYLCQEMGIPRSVALFATGFEIMLVIASAVIVYAVAAVFVPEISPIGIWINPVLAGVAIVFVNPWILNWIIKKVTKDFSNIKLTYPRSLFLLLMYSLTWIGYGIGFYLVATSVVVTGASTIFRFGNSIEEIFSMIGINAAAWVVGFVSLLTPAGLGVREGISSLLSGRVLEAPYPNLVPLSARVWITICEAITILLVLRRR